MAYNDSTSRSTTQAHSRRWDDVRDAVRSAISPADVLRNAGVDLHKDGQGYKMRCLWHSEDTASCHVYSDHAHCFGCGTSGDVFEIYTTLFGRSHGDAVKDLADQCGVQIPQWSPEEKQRVERQKRTEDLIGLVARTAFDALWSADTEASGAARAYLAKRGISEDAAKAAGIGLLPDWSTATKAIETHGVGGVAAGVEAGLVAARQGGKGFRDQLHHCLIFPVGPRARSAASEGLQRITTLIGRPVPGLAGPDDARAKTQKLPQDVRTPPPAPTLYWSGPAPREYVVVCEGEIDALTLGQCGISAVGLLGSQNAGDALVARDICGGPASRRAVYILPDQDRAGRQAAAKLALGLRGQLRVLTPWGWRERSKGDTGRKDDPNDVFCWALEDLGDIGQVARKMHADVSDALTAALPWHAWEAQRIVDECGRDRTALARKVESVIAPVLASIAEPIQRTEASKTVCELTKINRGDLTAAVKAAEVAQRRAEMRLVGGRDGSEGHGGVGDTGDAAGGEDDRPKLVLQGDLEMRARIVLRWIEEDQRKNGCTLFRRGADLVRVAQRPDGIGVEIEKLEAERLCEYVQSRAKIYVPKGEDVEATDFPLRLAGYILAKPTWDRVPALQMVYRCPVVTPSGDVVHQSGYRPDIKAWVDLGDLKLPHVPERPTNEDIAAARKLIEEELLGDFPFDGPASRANAIAFGLLPFIQPLLGACPTPLHVFSAPTEGSGKSLLSGVLSQIATGKDPTSITESRDDDEWRKRLTSTLKASPAVVRIDNVARKLDSGSVASMLTSRWWTDRDLGRSDNVTLRNEAAWCLTANNPSLSPEIGRRSCWIRLVAESERPAEREGFRHALPSWSTENRPALAQAYLTLVRHWMAAGCVRSDLTMGSYEDWIAIVGGILDAAGIVGFMANRDQGYRQSGADAAEWRAFYESWWDRHKDTPVHVKDLAELADKGTMLEDVLGDGGERSQRTRLGKALGQRVDRVTEIHKGDMYRCSNVKLVRGTNPKAKISTYQLVRLVGGTLAGHGGTCETESPASQVADNKGEKLSGGTCGTSVHSAVDNSAYNNIFGESDGETTSRTPNNVPHVPPTQNNATRISSYAAGHSGTQRPANVPPSPANVPPTSTTGTDPPNNRIDLDLDRGREKEEEWVDIEEYWK